MAGSTAMGAVLNQQLSSSLWAASDTDDYKALICIFLGGGNDSYNMLVPSNNDEYDTYGSVRSDLHLSRSELLTLDPARQTDPNRLFAVHNALPLLQTEYAAGNAAFIADVGTLIERLSYEEYKDKTKDFPRAIGSHLDQQRQWQTLPQEAEINDSRQRLTGWVGRMADALVDRHSAMNFTLSNSQFQSGNRVLPYTLNPGGPPTFSFDSLDPSIRSAMEHKTYRNVLQQGFADKTAQSLTLNSDYQAAYKNVNDLGIVNQANYEGDHEGTLSPQLRTAAVSIRGALLGNDSVLTSQRRQCYYLSMGGFDTHSELKGSQNALLGDLNKALTGFWRDLQGKDENGNLRDGVDDISDRVTVFSCSDFGRKLTSNRQGSDHGWSGHQFVLGGDVKGGDVYGNYPEDLSDPGVLVPSTSCDEYFYHLAKWFGVSELDIEAILPNIVNFRTGLLRNFMGQG